MLEKYFAHVIDIGSLYLKDVLFQFEGEPILFICEDGLWHEYLCYCSEIRFKKKWIIIACNITLQEIVTKCMTDIRSVFLQSPMAIIVEENELGIESSYTIATAKLDPLDLPEENVYAIRNTRKGALL